jgi:hypothetical protein
MKSTEKDGISRREFARRAGLAGAAATFGAASGLAQSPASTSVDAATGVPLEAQLRVNTILTLYEGRFSAAQKADLLKMSNSAQKSLDKLRGYKIENSDEPALHLKPLMERQKKPTTPQPVANAAPADAIAPAKKS